MIFILWLKFLYFMQSTIADIIPRLYWCYQVLIYIFCCFVVCLRHFCTVPYYTAPARPPDLKHYKQHRLPYCKATKYLILARRIVEACSAQISNFCQKPIWDIYAHTTQFSYDCRSLKGWISQRVSFLW